MDKHKDKTETQETQQDTERAEQAEHASALALPIYKQDGNESAIFDALAVREYINLIGNLHNKENVAIHYTPDRKIYVLDKDNLDNILGYLDMEFFNSENIQEILQETYWFYHNNIKLKDLTTPH